MEVKKIVEGMTAPQVAEVIDSNFRGIKEETNEKLSELGSKVGSNTNTIEDIETEISLEGSYRAFDGSVCKKYGLIKSNGEIIHDDNYGSYYLISDKIPVSKRTVIKCNGLFNSKEWAGLALYEADGTTVYTSINSSSVKLDLKEYPSVAYCVLSIYYTDKGYFEFLSRNPKLIEEHIELNENVSVTNNLIQSKELGLEVCNRIGLIKPDGELEFDKGDFGGLYVASDLMTIPPMVKIITATNILDKNDNAVGIALYDSDYNLISTYGGKNEIELNGAEKYFRVGCYKDSVLKVTLIYKYNELRKEIERQKTAIESVNRIVNLQTKRLFDNENLTIEGLIRADGTLFYDNNHAYGGVYYFSEPIKIIDKNETIVGKVFDKSSEWAGLVLYDADGLVIDTLGGNVNIKISDSYPNADSFRFGNIKSVADIVQVTIPSPIVEAIGSNANELSGKTWVAMGDSWTEGAYIESCSSYVNEVSGKLNLNVVNLGVGGTGVVVFADNFTEEIANQADLITIWGSINDMANNARRCGEITDEPNSGSGSDVTLMAQWKYTIEKVLSLAPSKRLIVVGCPIALHSSWNGYNPYNSHGDTIESSTAKIGELCRHYGIPFIDMFHLSGFNSYNFNNKIFDHDGVHPNYNGVMRVSSILSKELKRLY